MNDTTSVVLNARARLRGDGSRGNRSNAMRRRDRCMISSAGATFGASVCDVPLPSVRRFLAGKAQIMALAEQRRAQQLVPVPIRI